MFTIFLVQLKQTLDSTDMIWRNTDEVGIAYPLKTRPCDF